MPLANTDIYGQIVTLYDLEQAVLTHLRNWIPTYCAEIERQADLPPQTIPLPPDPDKSYKGGIDFDTWMAGNEPVLIVVVQPTGSPERFGGEGSYSQWFQIQVAAVVQMEDEDTARQYAQWYGSAVLAALLQHPSLGTFANGNYVASRTLMAGYPTVQFPDAEALSRRICRSVVTVHSAVDNVVTEARGPSTPPANPYALPGAWPEVETYGTSADFIADSQPV